MVKLSESPVDEFECLGCGVDDDILWFHISVHDAFGVTVVKCLGMVGTGYF